MKTKPRRRGTRSSRNRRCRSRPLRGGDLQTKARQHGGFFGFIKKLIGLGSDGVQKQMSDPIKQQMMMQRGGFPWALAGLSLLPMLMGKGGENPIQKQMRAVREPIMQRGGFAIPPALIARGLPLLKAIGIPLAMGALASVGDNVVDKVFGNGGTSNGGVDSVVGSGGAGRRGRTPTTRRVGKRGVKRQRPLSKPSKRRGGVRTPSSTTGRRRARGATRSTGRKTKRMPVRGRRAGTSRRGQLFSTLVKQGRRAVGDRLQSTGRRLFDKVKSKAQSRIEAIGSHHQQRLNDSPFARKIRENMTRASSSSSTPLTSSHIGQTFNI